MRASKLITISTVAVLMGGTSLAVGLESRGSTQSNDLIQGRGTNPRAAETAMYHGKMCKTCKISGESGSKAPSLRSLERGQAMAAEQGHAITGKRGQVMATARGQATTAQGAKTAEQRQGQLGWRTRQSFGQTATAGPVHARASASNAEVSLSAQQRTRLRNIVSAHQEIPRASNLSDVRVNAVIPRGVRLAGVPEELSRVYPRFRRDRAFIFRDKIVIVDPATSRIVALLPA
jgi:Protein of unknown function (DUF1236)